MLGKKYRVRQRLSCISPCLRSNPLPVVKAFQLWEMAMCVCASEGTHVGGEMLAYLDKF